jgi:phage/plasmid-like protein (TIGR03299 family)
MAHDIAFDKMFLGVREPAWHNLGTVWQTEITPMQALKEIGGDFEIYKYPIFTNVVTPNNEIQMKYLNDKVALMREPIEASNDWDCMGIVGKDYEVIQHRDVAELLTPISEEWGLETVGILGNGGEIFMTLRIGDWDVKGEEIKEYFLAHNASDGKTGFTLAYTPIRVVCRNTLTWGKNASTVKATMAHRKGVRDDAEVRMSLLRDLQKSQNTGRDAFLAMSDAILNAKDIQKVIEGLYPLPKKPKRVEFADAANTETAGDAFNRLLGQAKYNYDYSYEKAEENRAIVRELLGKHNDEFPQTANTAWALYNSVVEYADFRDSGGKGDQWSSALFGVRAQEKAKAFDLTYAFAK